MDFPQKKDHVIYFIMYHFFFIVNDVGLFIFVARPSFSGSAANFYFNLPRLPPEAS